MRRMVVEDGSRRTVPFGTTTHVWQAMDLEVDPLGSHELVQPRHVDADRG